MASQQNLVTRARLEQIKAAQTELVNNLFKHANASLSKAHGINLRYLPVPYYDAAGNDVSMYLDSHGDRVGRYYMVLNYNRINYFVPIEATSLPGKDPETGISRTLNTPTITTAPGGTAWVTDFTPQDEQDLINTNTQVLLPHTQEAHWETHSGGLYQVIPQVTVDSAGHRVADYLARIIVDGVELLLPCSRRLGGPLQPVRPAFPGITTLIGTNCNYCSMGRDDTQFGYFYVNLPAGGTLPYIFEWQLNSYVPTGPTDPLLGSGEWVSLVYSTGFTAVPAQVSWVNTHSKMVGTAEYPYELVIRTASGNNSGQPGALVRGKFTNAAGSTYTNWCYFRCNDEDGSWIFSGPDTNQSASRITLANDPVYSDNYYYPPGPPI
jgi:hypothetical protein